MVWPRTLLPQSEPKDLGNKSTSLIIPWCYKHVLLTVSITCAPTSGLKSDYAAQASGGSDLGISTMHALAMSDASCHLKTIGNHKFYKQRLQSRAPAMLSKRCVLFMLHDHGPRWTQVAPKYSKIMPRLLQPCPRLQTLTQITSKSSRYSPKN